MEKILCPKNLFVGIFRQNYFFVIKKILSEIFFLKFFFIKRFGVKTLSKKKNFCHKENFCHKRYLATKHLNHRNYCGI